MPEQSPGQLAQAQIGLQSSTNNSQSIQRLFIYKRRQPVVSLVHLAASHAVGNSSQGHLMHILNLLGQEGYGQLLTVTLAPTCHVVNARQDSAQPGCGVDACLATHGSQESHRDPRLPLLLVTLAGLLSSSLLLVVAAAIRYHRRRSSKVCSSSGGGGGGGDGSSVSRSGGVAAPACLKCNPAAQQGKDDWSIMDREDSAREFHGVLLPPMAAEDGEEGVMGQSTQEAVVAMPQSAAGTKEAEPRLEEVVRPPAPKWKDVLLPPDAVVLSRGSSGSLVSLGKGASGEVYRAQLHGVTPIAAKVVTLTSEDGSVLSKRRFLEEASTMWGLGHPNIAQLYGVVFDGSSGILAMELMRRGDLSNLLTAPMPDRGGRLLGWYNRGRSVALQVACGLAYLHSNGLLHLDIKPQNVLLASDFTAKLGDLGFCRRMTNGCVTDLGDRLGTFNWAAPEVLLGEPATDKADVFSFGVLLWQIITGESAVRGDIYPVTTPHDCPAEAAALQQRCLARDPQLRPTAAEALAILRSCKDGRPPAPATSVPMPEAAASAVAGTHQPAVAVPAPLRCLELTHRRRQELSLPDYAHKVLHGIAGEALDLPPAAGHLAPQSRLLQQLQVEPPPSPFLSYMASS